MCLKIDKNHHPKLKPKIAAEDIYTLKVSKCCNITNKPKSYFKHSIQNYNTILKSDLLFKRFFNDVIEEGLHSLISGITNTMRGDFFDGSESKKIIILCRIPKGSKYFIGMDNDIVSNQLELIQPILGNDKYFNYIKKNSMKYNLIKKNIFDICVEHCKEAGYKIGIK